MKIINVGEYPPPFGGISVHVSRLHDFLITKNIDSIVIDISLNKKKIKHVFNKHRLSVLFFILKQKKGVVHFHNSGVLLTLIMLVSKVRHKVVLSFHNERFIDEMKIKGNFFFLLQTFLINRLDCIIVDNPKCVNLVETFVSDKKRIHLIPEFIPPSNIPEIGNSDILKIRNTHQYLVSSNASKLDRYNGNDMYGIDLVIEMQNILRHRFALDVGVVFLLTRISDTEYYSKLLKMIKDYNLQDHFLFVTEPIEESSSLWKISDVIVRATNTDGNSITIHEGLNLDIPVIASDCVERPSGSVLFANRNFNDLAKKTAFVLQNINAIKADMKNIQAGNNGDSFLNLYQNLYKENQYES